MNNRNENGVTDKGHEFRTKEDICAHLGDDYDRYLGAIVPPIFQNSLFTRKTKEHGYIYTRIGNPTTEIAERKIAALEEGEAARCFSSGMGAISAAIMSVLSKDSHVICAASAYGPTRQLLDTYLARFGLETTYVHGTSIDEFERAVRPNTRLIFLESPSSHIFAMQDLAEVARLAKAKGISTIIDNTWATPLFQNPLKLGIDLVVHSASKYLGGHSDIIGGVAVGTAAAMERLTHEERALYGAIMDPHQAWLLLRGLRTLPVRLKQHEESGMKVAAFLEGHPKVERVLYPGLPSHPQYELGRRQMSGNSGLLSFIPKASDADIMSMIPRLRFFELGPSWGGFESLIATPGIGVSEESLAAAGIPRGLLRISVGLESAETLMEDLDWALSGLA
ncbi:trans-sulfuration enzyme family protein [Paenibacillus contaminans]|uniref:homocysteine desulfhydrase n=1 Tax=Paenibacillus contaminans TaxID=450362 RepID=A0A329MST5_9BACL|nr:PLP-dependent aspartate aminotransferase family protein [Paenibacillus contaminans]RAV23005.1 cystathionine beta-lyase/cystathionine gamma-synthase [Paenibacillus contaminans]